MDEVYRIPEEYFFRLHHVRPRFKKDVEEVLLYVATSISEIDTMPAQEFNVKLNNVLSIFKKNQISTPKTIDNWRTEISSLFGFIQESNGYLRPGLTTKRLSNNQYLDEFFNYFLYTFQYPGGHIKSQKILQQVKAKIKFKPCPFVLSLLLEGSKLTGSSFYITAEELTQCAYYDLRVTRGERTPKEVAELILNNREGNKTYKHKYPQLWNEKTKSFPSKGDVYRYAGDMLDYMVLANLLQHKGTGYYYYLNSESMRAINYHIGNSVWFDGYDPFFDMPDVLNLEVENLECKWFDYVNSFDKIEAFAPWLNEVEIKDISSLVQEYYSHLQGDKKIPTKIFGDYGEALILAHEYLRTRAKTKRQHLINKIPTALGVGYDLQSVEADKLKRYIEVKTTKSRKALSQNRFRLSPNEWDTAETLGERYFIYYLVINDNGKQIFIIQNPVEQHRLGNVKIDGELIVEFSNKSGEWCQLLEVTNKE